MALIAELIRFFRARKKLWLLPVVLIMLLFGIFLVLAETSAVAPFIYTLF